MSYIMRSFNMLVLVIVAALGFPVVSAGDCIQQTAKLGQQNLNITVSFKGDIQENNVIKCNINQTLIGQCAALHTSSCSVELQNVGVYQMNWTDDLKSVTITILTLFNETLSGDYSCFKTNDEDRKTICLTTDTKMLRSAALSDPCKKAAIGDTNVSLDFIFKWKEDDFKSIECSRENELIGQCSGNSVLVCSVEELGTYTIMQNKNFKGLTMYITQFTEKRTGNYTCSNFKEDSKSVCIYAADEVTPKPPTPKPPTAKPPIGVGNKFGMSRIV